MPSHSRRIRSRSTIDRRSGFTTPAVAIALLIVMMGLALIIDRIWLETARLELRTAAEAAALGAAGELASDELLLPSDSSALRINDALQVAGWIASENYVCGTPVSLNIQSEGDVRFGSLVQQPAGIQFQESSVDPTTVVVTALRTRSNSNPVAMFMSSVWGVPFGDVAVRVEASIGNDVIGLRPISGTPIPALPIAIWNSDPTGQQSQTWANVIGSGVGSDNYAFDPTTHSVIASTDGIPELVLHSLGQSSLANASNVLLVDLGTGLADAGITRQFETGIAVNDLQNLGGELLIGQGESVNLNSSSQFNSAQITSFQNLIGEQRLCFLYVPTSTQQQTSIVSATCTDIVAIRIMAVQGYQDGSCDVTIQPTVMTTRNAMLASEPVLPPTTTADSLTDELSNNVSDTLVNDVATALSNSSTTTNSNVIPNLYVYKLRLTH